MPVLLYVSLAKGF